MHIQASELVPGDVIQEYRGRGKRQKKVFTKVKKLRYGGHTPESYFRKGGEGKSVPIEVSSTPERLQPSARVIVNEEFSYGPTDSVTVLRADEDVLRRIAGGAEEAA